MRVENYIKDENGNNILASVEDVQLFSNVSDYKKCLIQQIDLYTENKIKEGFVFDGNIFSMSVNAQINWYNFPSLPSSVFPLTVNTKNDTEYMLSESNKLNFYFTALNYKNTCLQDGNTKKKAVIACETIEELEILL